MTPESTLKAEHRPEFLGGVTVIKGEALGSAGNQVPLTAEPYHAWANRESNPMTVWIDERPPTAPAGK